MGFLLTWSWQGAITAFLWGSFVRVFLLHHITWSINSICHFFGRRPYETTDYSTNNWPLAIVSMGESWHNNHHAFPTAARHGLRWYQVDVTGTLISIMARFGWVWDVKMPTMKQLEAKSLT
jgi:stearoyl-CoA desaturase (delta-9 desaturase)